VPTAAPRDAVAGVVGETRVGLGLDTRLVQLISANGARIGANVPRPKRHGVPFLHDEAGPLLAVLLHVHLLIVRHLLDSNKAGPVEAEKELLDKFRHVLKPFIADKPKLQLAAVYALQMSCNALCFPKGLLLRSFVNFYEMDIVDEHAFLQWKEDVNETYPGKGKALFQVNSWLTWLEEAESEEEEDEDEED